MKKIDFSPPDVGNAEADEVRDALLTGWITTGPKTRMFEKKLEEYIGVKKGVCLSSATAAEECTLRIIGIEEGDEVIVPAYTYTSTAAAAIHVGARVVFVDSEPETYEMDYDAVAKAITKKTKAIIPVDLGGCICDYEKIYEVVNEKKHIFTPSIKKSRERNIQEQFGRVLVVSDSAHALGGKRKIYGKWKNAGNIADFSTFSFHAVKNLTTGEGGFATWRKVEGIEDEDIYSAFQLMSLHGQSKDAFSKSANGQWEYDIVEPYYKCNMTDIMAAIGLKQLERYDRILFRRKEIIKQYDDFCDKEGIIHLNHYTQDMESSGHLYLTRIPEIGEKDRNAIINKMSEMGVATNVHYKPLPMMTAYKKLGWNIKDFPNAYNYYANLITLPLHTLLSDEDVEYVLKCYRKALEVILKR